MTQFPYEEERYALNTTPSAAATTGVPMLLAMSTPGWNPPERPPNPDEIYPDAGRVKAPEETSGSGPPEWLPELGLADDAALVVPAFEPVDPAFVFV